MAHPGEDALRGFSDYQVRLGDEMRGKRATMGKSLIDVERDLHIRAHLIHAIEKADINGFEFKWVIPGYVRAYSKYLGMDPEIGYQRFCEEADVSSISGNPNITDSGKKAAQSRKTRRANTGIGLHWAGRTAPKRHQASLLILRESYFDKRIFQTFFSSLLICGLISGIGYMGWTFYDAINSVRQASYSQPLVADIEIGVLEASAATVSSVASGTTASPPNFSAQTTMGQIRRGQFGIYSNSDVAPAKDATAASEIAVTSIQTAASPQSEPQSEVDSSQVVIVPTRNAWFRVTTEDGTTIEEDTLLAGNEFSVPQSSDKLQLRIGNSGSVYFVVGNEVYGPAGQGTSVAKNVNLAADEIRKVYHPLQSNQVPPAIIKIGLYSPP